MDEWLKFRIPKEDNDVLGDIAKYERTSKASIARKAIAEFIRKYQALDKK